MSYEQRVIERKITNHIETERQRYIRMAADWLHDPGSADDAVQEAAFDAMKGAVRFTPGKAVGPWFAQVLKNRCRMILRSRSRRPETVDAEILEDTAAVFDTIDLGGIVTLPTEDGKVIDIPLSSLLAGASERDISAFIALVNGSHRDVIMREYGYSSRLEVTRLRRHMYEQIQARAAELHVRYN